MYPVTIFQSQAWLAGCHRQSGGNQQAAEHFLQITTLDLEALWKDKPSEIFKSHPQFVTAGEKRHKECISGPSPRLLLFFFFFKSFQSLPVWFVIKNANLGKMRLLVYRNISDQKSKKYVYKKKERKKTEQKENDRQKIICCKPQL